MSQPIGVTQARDWAEAPAIVADGGATSQGFADKTALI